MNTIEIRKKNPELIERLRESVRSYIEWRTDDILPNKMYSKINREPYVTYEDFLKQCIVDDIKALQTINKGE
jgi:hypothetical protein